MSSLREDVRTALSNAGLDDVTLEDADAAIAAMLDAAEKDYEVWEDDLMVAASTSEDDARHYLRVYSQDADVVLKTAYTWRSEGVTEAIRSLAEQSKP